MEMFSSGRVTMTADFFTPSIPAAFFLCSGFTSGDQSES
jgi:hypothetical protein